MDDVGANRLHEHPVLGSVPDRERVAFTLDGRTLHGYSGEPIAAALMAHGVVLARTMPETVAPRGYFCGVGRCSDCAMTVNGELNVRTCVAPLQHGMRITTQQGLGSWEAN